MTHFGLLSLAAILLAATMKNAVDATFSPSFKQFLLDRYGAETTAHLERTDIDANNGLVGSYGGGDHDPARKTEKMAVVFVHGVNSRANLTQFMRDYYIANGNYTEAELYATTWGPATNGQILCDYVKTVRTFIEAVVAFTGQRVHVVAISSGNAVARKALLGGRCVDTDENLGGRFEGHVETYVSIVGINYGVPWCNCSDPSGATCATFGNMPYNQSCHQVNGLRCGSDYFNDINNASRYEGKHIFSILTTDDDAIGYIVCGDKVNAAVPGADDVYTTSGLNHSKGFRNTLLQQFNYVTKHSVV